MRTYRLVIGSSFVFWTACAGWSGVCDNHACDSDASLGDAGDSGVDAPPGCNPDVDPKDSPACVADSFGIFVDAANGNDTNAGTKEAPVKTIGAALGKVGSLTRVYVCEGTYLEDLLLDASHDGVSIYGGWKCSDWSYSGGKPFVGLTQLAAKLDSLTKPVTLSDLEFDAANGDTTNLTSTAMLVNASGNVTLERVKLKAGVGHDGTDASAGTNYNTSLLASDPSIKGNDASGSSGGGAKTCTTLCTIAATTSGGAGGAGGLSTQGGSDGTPNLGGLNPQDGKGGNKDMGTGCTSGDKGANGDAGAPAASPTVLGSLDATGWKPSAGSGGELGGIGQGGGGGGGGLDVAGSGGGGGGGCGGCGGASGGGGTGGGGSVALAVVGSMVTLTSSQLIATTAGRGGNGAAGEAGQGGGNKGALVGNGCAGGSGGSGGSGGTGAGGAGGISVGILWSGSQPTADSSTTAGITVAGAGGAKGIGGSAGSNDGPSGVAQAVLPAP